MNRILIKICMISVVVVLVGCTRVIEIETFQDKIVEVETIKYVNVTCPELDCTGENASTTVRLNNSHYLRTVRELKACERRYNVSLNFTNCIDDFYACNQSINKIKEAMEWE